MPIMNKVEVRKFAIYDGTNGQEIFDAMGMAPSGSILSDDGVTLVIEDGGGTQYTYTEGEGWDISNRVYWGGGIGAAGMAERFLTVVDGRVILAP